MGGVGHAFSPNFLKQYKANSSASVHAAGQDGGSTTVRADKFGRFGGSFLGFERAGGIGSAERMEGDGEGTCSLKEGRSKGFTEISVFVVVVSCGSEGFARGRKNQQQYKMPTMVNKARHTTPKISNFNLLLFMFVRSFMPRISSKDSTSRNEIKRRKKLCSASMKRKTPIMKMVFRTGYA